MSFNEQLANIKQEDFEFIFKNGKRSSVLDNIDFESLCYSSYRFVKDKAPELIKEGNFERLIYEIFKDRKVYIFENDVNNFNFNECLYFVFWIIDDLKHWTAMEQQHLNSEPEFEMIAAGINELNIFGDLNTIDMLAGGDIMKWEQIKDLPYQNVFDKQLKSIKEAKFQKEYAKRMQDKAKSKNKIGR